MRRAVGYGLAASALLLLAAGAGNAAEAIKWKTFAEAQAQAKKTHKLIMIDFYTDWCGWCKKLDKDTYTDKGVVQLSQQLVPVKVDAEKGEGKPLAQKYGVHSYPTILFIDENGKVADTLSGYLPPAGFSQKMQDALSIHDLPNLQARYKANPNDVSLVAKLVTSFAAKGDAGQSGAMLAQQEKLDPQNAKGMLSKSYSAVGDLYQTKQNFDKAIPLFRKAIQTGKSPYDLAYAHISIASCYAVQNKFKEALPEFKATAAVPNCPPDLKSGAQQAIAQLSRVSGPR